MVNIWSPLTTHWSVTSDSSPRYSEIDSIGHHHGATTSLNAALSLFQPGGKTVSPNYCVYRDQIWGIVPENRRAWTSSSEWADARSITYEIINSSGDPHWAFDPVTLNTVMRLDADIMRRYPKIPAVHGIPGFWEHRNLNEWWGISYATACAGPSFNIGAIIAGTKHYLNPPIPKPQEEEMICIRIQGRDKHRYGGAYLLLSDKTAIYLGAAEDRGFANVPLVTDESAVQAIYKAFKGLK